MRNRLQLLVTPLLIAAQVAHTYPVSAADSTQALAKVEVKNQNVTLNLDSPKVIEVKPPANFDTDVLVPLRAAQAARAKADAEAAAARLRALRTRRVIGPVTGDVWYRLRMCESGNNYARVSSTGKYRGAYQYDVATWANYGGYVYPDQAPAEVQDAKARETQARRGWSPWPTCASKLGLL
jgi:hypothetical protein